MTITAQSILSRATQVLQDTTSTRWPARELTRWLNDGQREVAIHRPDATTKTATGTCVAGTRQSLKTMTGVSSLNPAKLLDVPRNMPSGRSLRMVAREILDAQNPNWHSMTGTVTAIHFTHDERDPTAFYVYPPATTSTQLEIVFSANPTDVTLPAEGVTIALSLSDTDTSVVSGNLDLPDLFAGAVLDYVLYRAYTKDADYAGNLARAQAHYTAFANALGIDAKNLFMSAPGSNQKFNPNVPKGGLA